MDLNRLRISSEKTAAVHGPRRLGWIITCLLCLATGFGAGFYYRQIGLSSPVSVKTVVVGAGAVNQSRSFTGGGWIEVARPAYPVTVASRISERLESLTVREGQMLESGQVVARLYDKDIASRLELSRAKRKALQSDLDRFQAGYRKEEADAAAARADETAERVRIAKANYERSKSLPEGAVSHEALDKELSEYRVAQAVHAQALASLETFKAGYRKEDIAAAKAQLEEASLAVELADRELTYCTVCAPTQGPPLRVLKVLKQVGDWIDAGKSAELLWLYDPKNVQVRVDITQQNIQSVVVGGAATVSVDAAPDRKYVGKVLRIEPLAELSKNTVTVRVAIENPDLMLFPEMVAQVTFLGAGAVQTSAQSQPAGIAVPIEAVITEGGDRFVYVCIGGKAVRKKVTVSGVESGLARIGQGLQAGQRVIVGDLASLRDGMKVEEK